MHKLTCCGIVVELLRVKEPQEVSQQPDKVARRKCQKKQSRGNASVAVKPSLRTSADIVIISSDDDVFEK
jgi:hypothetical protein